MRRLGRFLVTALFVSCFPIPLHSAPDSEASAGDPSSGWQRQVGQQLAAEEYRVSWQDAAPLDDLTAAWQAPNRAQGFRSFFTPDGVRLVPRTGAADWSCELSLVAYGRGSVRFPIERAVLSPDGNVIRLDRRLLDEWFVNGPEGLKHNFTLFGPPGDRHVDERGAPLRLELRVGGSLRAVVDAMGRSARFADASGMGVLYYRDLVVRDATGLPLDAWMEADASASGPVLRLMIDDRGAVYPIEVDPLTTGADWTDEVRQNEAWLGVSVGTAGDVNGDGYDDMIIGAFHYDVGFNNEGAAFLYLGSADGLPRDYDWMVSGGEAVAFAGRSVGTAGDVNGDGYDDVLVGVPLLDPSGRVWVFHGSPDGPLTTPDWEGQTDALSPSTGFGQDAGTAGDVNGDGYDDVIVGAPNYGTPGFNQDGGAFVFLGSASGLSLEPSWSTAGEQDNAAYGISVGGAGDVNGDGYDDVIVGAYQYDNGQTDEGRVFVYYGSASRLSTVADWIYENDDEGACLGGSVDIAGDVNRDGYDDVIVGASYHQCFDAPSSPVGKAIAFHGSADGPATEPLSTREMTQTGSMFGRVATAGDVNGDGYDDVLVGASWYDGDLVDEGAAFLYLGSPTGLSTAHAWMVEGNQTESEFGFGIGTAGDVNGDGAADVVVGAYMFDDGRPGSNDGAAFLYLGSLKPGSPGGTVGSLVLDKLGTGQIRLEWDASCMATDTDYAIYEGTIGDYTSHEPIAPPNPYCTTGGLTDATVTPAEGDRYYLVVPISPYREGSYGMDGDRVERSQGPSSCLVQEVGACS